ncbi:unnamed protein product [Cuscuta campestris]|uniref:Uncharacterized protein n=1 Tax=Cuscuta campestris TaxID=132261 RepID=A0A484K972_9ASTE|nr:unnamed protein product [Cuscuta campestris]
MRATASLLLPFKPIPRRHLSTKSSFAPLDKRKPSKRISHLRPKILKNPPVPIESSPPPTNPVTPSESPPEKSRAFHSDGVAGEDPNESEIQEVSENLREIQVSQVPEPSIVVNHGKAPTFNFLLWLGVVIVAWISWPAFSGSEEGENSGEDEVSKMGVVGNSIDTSKLETFLNENGNGGIKKKIEEIQAMAREARAKEKLGAAESSESDDEDEDEDSFASNPIGKEVENRLLMLHKPLKRSSEKLSEPLDDNPRRNSVKNDLNAALLFKKKHKFRDFSGEPSRRPKGFTGVSKPDEEEQEKGDASIGEGKASLEERDENSGVTLDVANSEHETGMTGTTVISNKTKSSKTNLNAKRGKAIERQSGKKSRGTKSEKETNFWWLSLPYILVVHIHGYLNGERPQEQFFSIKSSSGDSSYIVAFEDHVDATNFCYLLQSYNDLEDNSPEIVIVSIDERGVKSGMENVIVVRKGQLKLYAGQPLGDVEMALRALIGQT